jgi:acyl transferase domain-containing protein
MSANRNGPAEPVAIVGMEVLLPAADSLETYWHNLVNGVDAISDAPPLRWDPEHYNPEESHRPDRLYCRRGGFVDEFVSFDPMRFGVMPASVEGTEPEQLIALRVAASAIEDAGGLDRLGDRDRVGVILGRGGYSGVSHIKFNSRVKTPDQLKMTLRELLPDVPEDRLDIVRERLRDSFGPMRPEAGINLVPNLVASRIANRLDLRGPAYNMDGACASSLLAVDHAIAELASGRLDAVLAGGVHHVHDIGFWAIFNMIGGLSRRGEIRPFDTSADGLLIGEGTGVVVLKRLADAVRAGDRIYAVIRGSGTSSDGRAASLVNPETGGQVIAIRRAWAAAGLDPAAPDSLGLLEAHGTATPVGDAVEIATVASVFGRSVAGQQPVIGSVKSMIGHAMPAAGIAGLVKAVLAVHRGMQLPTLHCDDPRPELAGTRFEPVSAARPWPGAGPRRAAVNAFGFGGINAHVIVEEAPEPPRPRRRPPAPAGPAAAAEVTEPDQIVWLAGPDVPAMARLLDADDPAIRAHSTNGPNGSGSPPSARCRLGIVGPTPERLAAARKVVAAGNPWRGGRDIWFTARPLLAGGTGQIAYVFPGLEAEFAPRVDDLAARFGLQAAGLGLGAQDFAGHLTAWVQVGRLLHDALEHVGVRPDAFAGHSLGEWTAILLAGLIDEERLADYAAAFEADTGNVRRDDLLHAVIGDGAPTVAARLADYPGVVLTLDNAPAQSVVCGPVDQVTRLIDDLTRQNTLCRALPFTTGIHTRYLEHQVRKLRKIAGAEISGQAQARSARAPVWSATIGAPVPDDPAQRAELFFRHLTEPVRFRSTVQAMYAAGIRVFLQVGPGQLASLIHDNLRDRDHLAMPVNVAFHSGLGQLRRVLTALWTEGYPVDLSALDHPGEQAPARRSPAAGGMPMRLELGWGRVSLGDGASGLLGVPAITAPAAAAASATAVARLGRFAARSPAVAELAALLADTADAAVQVLTAVPQAPSLRYEKTLRLSLRDMPYLRDHCFFRQPDDWPHEEDRWPVVPATTIIGHLMEAAEAAAGGMRAVRVSNARFNRWVLAEPPQDVDITVRPGSAPGAFDVAFGGYARATVHTAAAYPAGPARAWQHDPATEWPSPISAERYYAERYTFHGPGIGGVVAVHAVGDLHVRGLLRTPPAPGGLLDSGLQLVGIWLRVTRPARQISFPMRFAAVRFFGPAPAEGDLIECVGRISQIDDRELTFSLQFSRAPDGPVWAVLEDGLHRRYDTHPGSRMAEVFPGRNAASLRQPEGWVMLFDYWPDTGTLLTIARSALGSLRFPEFEKQPAGRRKQWLMARIAVNDAARYQMWDNGAGEVFPIEVGVSDAGDGRARVDEWPARGIPPFLASYATAGDIAVAIASRPGAAPDTPWPGIGVAEITADAGADAAVATATSQAVRGARGRTCQVSHREVSNPDGLPARRYVVAWTRGPQEAASR